jgi:hypothetical protein
MTEKMSELTAEELVQQLIAREMAGDRPCANRLHTELLRRLSAAPQPSEGLEQVAREIMKEIHWRNCNELDNMGYEDYLAILAYHFSGGKDALDGKIICTNCHRQLNQHYTMSNFCDGESGPTFKAAALSGGKEVGYGR